MITCLGGFPDSFDCAFYKLYILVLMTTGIRLPSLKGSIVPFLPFDMDTKRDQIEPSPLI